MSFKDHHLTNVSPLGLYLFIIMAFLSKIQAQKKPEPLPHPDREDWVASKLEKMSLEEKIGQLMMVAVYSNRDEAHQKEIEDAIRSQYLGGLIFFQGDAEKQVDMTNAFQGITQIPLLIGQDAEWGLSMRLENTIKYPRQLMLGAIRDDQLIYDFGKRVAYECKRVGVNINFAPVIDINNNPANPVIHDRSFGENIDNVIRKSLLYQRGLEENGVMACAKHFPGHGDTDADSHFTLPILQHSLKRLEEIELKPFQAAISQGVDAIMIAHLSIPALDDEVVVDTTTGIKLTKPASLSAEIVSDLLRDKMKFEGLIITDALNMKGVTNFFPPGRLEVEALKAGNDILLFPQNVTQAIRAIKEAIRKKEIKEKKIDEHVRRILSFKYDHGLYDKPVVDSKNLSEDLNSIEAILFQRKLIENALTLAKNEEELVPIQHLEEAPFAHLTIGKERLNGFGNMLDHYAAFDHFIITKESKDEDINTVLSELECYSLVIVSLQNLNRKSSDNYGLDEDIMQKLVQLSSKRKMIFISFGSPYVLQNLDKAKTILQAYENNDITHSYSAQLLFGAIGAQGKLPVTVSPTLQYGMGQYTPAGLRLQYRLPEEAGIKSAYLPEIDRIARLGIEIRATPGCQVLIAKDGKVFYEKSFGFHSYENINPVTNSDLYDIASLTKIAGTLPAIMKMYETGGLNLEDKLVKHLPETAGSNKEKLVLQDMLIHQAGLIDWIPFYKETLEGSPHDGIYQRYEDRHHSLPVADHIFMKNTYADTIWKRILDSKIDESPAYKYSDLPFFFFKKIIEKFYNQPLDMVALNTWIRPLGMNNTNYLAKKNFPLSRIVPTENDTYFRKQLIQGYVHDMAAAMQGGIGGHAGLFTNANDLAKLMQMYLNGGSYGGKMFLQKRTLDIFTSTQRNGNRRGLGFDKPDLNKTLNGPTSSSCSTKTFGHTGFTGTCAWSDPEYGLVYIFLSNRIHPDMNNKKLLNENIRTRIMDEIYKALKDPYLPKISH